MGNDIRLAGVIRESIVDGPGIRFVVFTQGCFHNCKGCHNVGTHNPNGGYLSNTDNLLNAIKQNPMLKGVTLSGGEPFEQAEKLIEFAKEVHKLGLDIVVYSGYTFEQIIGKSKVKKEWLELLKECDILIDGKFILEQKSLTLNFRGSKNQRIIDVKKSLKIGVPVEIEL